MKRKLILAIAICLLLANLAFIFGNSLRDANASSESSGGVSDLILSILSAKYRNGNADLKQSMLGKWDPIIRELAHYLEFLPIGFLLCWILVLSGFSLFFRYRIAISAAAGAVFAIIDELLQLLSPGRAFELFDIVVDGMGVLTGIAIAYILQKITELKIGKFAKRG